MNPKIYALLTLSLVATVTLPVVNGKLPPLIPAVMAQNTNARKAEADRLLQQGIQQYQTSQFREALQSWEKALQIYREIKNRQGEMLSLGALGLTYDSLRQYQKAIEYHQQSLAIARELDYRQVESLSLSSLGLAYRSLGQYQKAIEYHQQSLAIDKEIGDRSGEANSLNNLGDTYNSLGQYQKAIEYLRQSLVIAREIGARQWETNSLGNLGNAYQSLGQYQKAIEFYQQSLSIAREIGDQGSEAKILGNLGVAYDSLGQYQKAIEYQQQSLAIARKIKDRSNEANSLNNLGDTYNSLGQYQKAIEYLRQSLVIAREIGDRQWETNSLGNLGNAYQSLGQYQKAIGYYQQSLAIARELGDRRGEAYSLGNLGAAYLSLGQYQKVIEYHQQSLAIAREIGDRSGEAASLGNLGIAYRSLGQYPKAIEYQQQHLTIAREIGDRQGEANSLGNLGNAYQSLGQYQKAIEYLQQSLAIARELGDRRGEAYSLGNLGAAYLSLGQYQKVIEYLQQTLAIAREIGDRSGEAASLGNLGIAYRSLGQYQKAIDNLEASLNITLKTRSELSRDDRKDFLAANENQTPVITLAEVLIQQNQPEKAFQWLNLATTADLADYNRLINAKVADPDAQKALDNWNTDNRQLEGMRRQLQDKYSQELAQQLRQFEEKVYKNAETIGEKYPEIAELFETKPTDIAQLQKNIAPDTLVIQPVPLRDKVALFLVTREKLIVIQSDAKRDDFNQLVSQYHNQLADYKNADYLVTGSKLYEILIRPIESQIATSSPKNIAIIATGQLRYIPFETLYDKKNDQVLLEKYPIYYLTRISTSTPPATERKPLQGLAFANPKPTQEELKGTEIEAETISKIFPGSEKYLGTNATLDIFKKQAFRFSILHLGTHGCFKRAGCPNLDMQANTILFANKEQYNIADAALLGLKNTELITLSACQTAKEANADGQEISGLAYVLERAGAKSVIASLWSAEDNTSAEIMTQFYQNLKNGMTKSEAMQKAKLSQIKSHPYFWSPFILIGAAN
ncbi:tetratricopeptide repeat protein [Microcystis sp. LEGE 08355]|uniref:CHAT domain-containing protein n=1 Tax=Microcystis sp. LEGE 08355 TaxID=1828687 RepID=UPI00187EA0D4|nr:tetratricopeptide repeat protein [Microcystis sp. LEGE 08355]MBE9072481.1 tetratricopeptide repeat protein [Microcystis sp. LEGE 08355]